MKKSCFDCKALIEGQGIYYRCELGFKIDLQNVKPITDCPKPRTNKKLVKLLSNKYKVTL